MDRSGRSTRRRSRSAKDRGGRMRGTTSRALLAANGAEEVVEETYAGPFPPPPRAPEGGREPTVQDAINAVYYANVSWEARLHIVEAMWDIKFDARMNAVEGALSRLAADVASLTPDRTPPRATDRGPEDRWPDRAPASGELPQIVAANVTGSSPLLPGRRSGSAKAFAVSTRRANDPPGTGSASPGKRKREADGGPQRPAGASRTALSPEPAPARATAGRGIGEPLAVDTGRVRLWGGPDGERRRPATAPMRRFPQRRYPCRERRPTEKAKEWLNAPRRWQRSSSEPGTSECERDAFGRPTARAEDIDPLPKRRRIARS